MIGIEKTLNIGLLLGKKHLQQQQNYSSTCRRSSHAAAGKTYLQQQQHHQHQHQRQHSAAEACSSSMLHTATVRNCPRRRWQNNKYKIRQTKQQIQNQTKLFFQILPGRHIYCCSPMSMLASSKPTWNPVVFVSP